MTDPVKPSAHSARPKGGWQRSLCRAAGLVAVVLGGWCLWLGFPATPKPLDSEVFQDWNQEASPARPNRSEVLGAKPDRLMARITHVSDLEADAPLHDTRVMTANRSDDTASDDGELAVAGYAPDVAAAPRRLVDEPASQAGAWLTGTIEDGAAEQNGPVHSLSKIPAWKRGSQARSPR